MKSAYNAFTLIELMVAISIMAIIAVYIFANYKSFGEDQNLKSAASDIQSLLRTAQTNATTNLRCNTPQKSAQWQTVFSNPSTIELKCWEPPNPQRLKKTLQLDTSIIIYSISGSGNSCPTGLPFTISFAPLSGTMKLGSDEDCSWLTITLRNTKTGSTKALKIEQGGRIYVP